MEKKSMANEETVAASPAHRRTAKTAPVEKTVASTVAASPARTVAAPAKGASQATVAAHPHPSARPATAPVRKAAPSRVKKIGNYITEKKLAQGGMGAVYIAKHPELDTRVIIKKLILKDNAAAEERFKREANILRELQCPYIVNTFEYFKERRNSYLVEELVDGCSLDRIIDKYKELRLAEIKDNPDTDWAKTGPIGTEIALLIFLDACYGLRFAHNRKIVHRDIKPGNLLISKGAEVKLTDFGIAADDKEEDADDDEDDEDMPVESEGLTMAGSMLGTPSYMSPEQVNDSSSVDQRADIYSMGVMLYEMLTGEKPFGCPINMSTLKPDEDVMRAIRKGRYTNPRKLNPSIPLSVCSMLRRMLKYDREKRYETIEPVIKTLKKFLSKYNTHDLRVELAKIVTALDAGKTRRIHIFVQKKPVLQIVAASALGALVLVCGISWLWRDGFFHRTLLSHWYTPVSLEMKIPDRGIDNGYSSNLPMVAYIFEEEGEQELVKGSSREFRMVEDRNKTEEQLKSSAKFFSTKPVYLTKGVYRVKVVLGSYVLWRSIKVAKEPISLVFDDLVKEKREISVMASAFDLKTKKPLKAKFTVMNSRGEYVPIDKITQKERTSMKVWKVRASCEGYSTREFSMVVDWYQDTIIVNVGLE